jgi:hypothetical protein
MELQNLLLVNYELWGNNLPNKRMMRKGFCAKGEGFGKWLKFEGKGVVTIQWLK